MQFGADKGYPVLCARFDERIQHSGNCIFENWTKNLFFQERQGLAFRNGFGGAKSEYLGNKLGRQRVGKIAYQGRRHTPCKSGILQFQMFQIGKVAKLGRQLSDQPWVIEQIQQCQLAEVA